jgi:hypothetical protein
MGAVLHLNGPRTVDEAWERYAALVNERAERNLWADLDHNRRLARAWDDWSRMYLGEEAAK